MLCATGRTDVRKDGRRRDAERRSGPLPFGLGLLALGSSWLVNAYRRGRQSDRLEARARDADR